MTTREPARRANGRVPRLARWLAAACVSAVLAPTVLQAGQGPAGAGEAGGATVLFQFNKSTNPAPLFWTGPLFTLYVPPASHADLRVDNYTFVPNWGKLQASADLVSTPDGFSAGRAMVQLSQVPVGGWTLDVSAGDRPLTVYSLDFRLGSLFNPSAGLRGVQATASKGGTAVSVFGGRTTAIGGYFGESTLVSQQQLYGARAVFSPSSRLTVGASLVRTAATPTPAWRPLPRSTTALTADAIYRVTNGVWLVGEASIGQYSGAPDLQRPSGQDYSLIAGSRIEGDGRQLEVSAVRLGPTYVPLGSFDVGDRAGLYASGNYRVVEALQLFGGLSWFHDNLLGSSARPTYTVDNSYLGGRYRLAPNSYLSGRVGRGGYASSSAADESSSRNREVSADFTQQFGTWRLLGRVHEIRVANDSVAVEHTVRRRADVEIRRAWKRGTNVWTTLGTLSEATRETGESKTSFAGNAGVSGSVRGVSVYGEASWNQEPSVLRTSSVHNTAFNAGFNWVMPGDILVAVSGRYSRDATTLSLYDQMALTPDSVVDLQTFLVNQHRSAYQFTVRLQKDLKWGRRPVSVRGPDAPARSVDLGSIAGSVFNDLNQDGIRDDGDQGVANTTVILDGHTRCEVDATGTFLFKNVSAGEHTVELELVTIPASFDVGPRPKATLRVARRATAEAHFPLIQLGKVSGRIIVIDRPNPDTRWQDDLAANRHDGVGRNLIVVLNDRYKVTLTDRDGEFEFRGIPAGEYRVRLDAASLPEFWEVVSEPESSVTLSPGGKVSDLEIVVGASPRPARRVILVRQPERDPGKKDDKK
jgi:hypothetical protein